MRKPSIVLITACATSLIFSTFTAVTANASDDLREVESSEVQLAQDFDGTEGSGDVDGIENTTDTDGNETTDAPQIEAQLTVSVSALSVEYGGELTLTAQVIGSAPTGTVEFRAGNSVLGRAAVQTDSTATLKVSSLAVGTYSLTAHYSGDELHTAATVTGPSVTITAVTSAITLSATPNTVTVGSLVTLNATVSGLTPTGSVQFLVNGVVHGVGVVTADGISVFQFATLPVGSHSVTAKYLGDDHHSAAVSSTVHVTVVPVTQVPEIPDSPEVPDGTNDDPPPTHSDNDGDADATAPTELAETGSTAPMQLAAALALLAIVCGAALFARRTVACLHD